MGNIVIFSNGGGSFIDEVNDVDLDFINEIEIWAIFSGILLDIVDGDDVIDGDVSLMNEF